MTKKDLQALISESVKAVIIKEIKPLIKTTIRQEFNKILEEAGSRSESLQEDREDDTSLTRLLENQEEDETRRTVGKKIFNTGGQFDNILNQTAEQYSGKPLANAAAEGLNEQKEVVLNTNTVMYGEELGKVGTDVKIPGVGANKMSPVKKLLNSPAPRNPNAPVVVSLPTKNADGRPINLNNVPASIVQNMMKNYSGLLNKSKKVSKTRGG